MIDDTPTMIEHLLQVLTDAGYCVTVSSTYLNRRQLLAMAPDIIVQGANTAGPHGSGWQYLTMMRRDPEVAGIPVILLTASEEMVRDPGTTRSLRRLGVRVLLTPFAREDLLTLVVEELETRRRIDDMWGD